MEAAAVESPGHGVGDGFAEAGSVGVKGDSGVGDATAAAVADGGEAGWEQLGR
ncbi:hypothetical protein CEP54_016410, partial [Fusarium duplospermum]